MAVGLRIRNTDGILQIDGEYKNFELVTTGTVTMNTDDNNLGRYAEVIIPGGIVNPILAVRTTSEGVWVVRYASNIFRIYVGARVNGKTATYYMFAEPSQASPAGGVGLIVRNESTGQIVYNSNKKYLRVLTPVVGSISPGQSIPLYYPAGKTIAVIQNLRPWQRKLTTGGTAQQPIFVIELSGGTMRTPDATTAVVDFRVYNTLTGFGGTQPATDSMYECNWTVVDVTGY